MLWQNYYVLMNQTILGKIKNFYSAYEQKIVSAGQIIIYAGEEPKGVILLEKGEIRQYDIAQNGAEIVVNTFKPHAFFPMSWAINKTPNQYFFESVGRSIIRIAPAKETVKFVKDNPDVCFDLLARVFSGADGVLRRSSHLMGGNAKTRLLFELVLLCRRFGEEKADGSYVIAVHEDELAKMVGLSRETVSRTIKEINGIGLIKISRKNIIIKDLNKLESLLGDDL